MSWFDATGLANIAKSALKEAQKTIDKALDIKDDVDETDNVEQKTSQNPEEGDFFSSWGLNERQKGNNDRSEVKNMSNVKESTVKSSTMPSSIWGSFTGSFFEVDSSKKENLVSTQPQKFTLLFSKDNDGVAPLATPENELTPVDMTSGFPSKYSEAIGILDRQNSLKVDKFHSQGKEEHRKGENDRKQEFEAVQGENTVGHVKISEFCFLIRSTKLKY